MTAEPGARERQRWTAREDEALSAAVAEVSVEGDVLSWHRIASYLPGRTNKDCRKRWHYKIACDIKKGPWTSEEDQRLLNAVRKHGTKWSKVATEIGMRNGDQCSKRWYDRLNPLIDHSPWTPEEDKLLVEGVEKMGRNWRAIVDTNFSNRTALASKNRYALLQRRRQSGAPGARDENSVSALSTEPAASASAVPNNDSSSQGVDTDFESALADWTDDGCVEFAESTVPQAVLPASSEALNHEMDQTSDLSMGADLPHTSSDGCIDPALPMHDLGMTMNLDDMPVFHSYPSLGSLNCGNDVFGKELARSPSAAHGNLQEMQDSPSTASAGSPSTFNIDCENFQAQSLLMNISSQDTRKELVIRATCEPNQIGSLIRAVSGITNSMMIKGGVSNVSFAVK